MLCHDMFFGLVGARWCAAGADALVDLTGSNVNLAKWTNVIAARSLEFDMPFLCTIGHWAFQDSGSADAIGFRSGRPLRPLRSIDTAHDGRVVIFDLAGEQDRSAWDGASQAFTDKRYRTIRVALGATTASAHAHVGIDRRIKGHVDAKASGWHRFKIGNAIVGVLALPLSALRDSLAIHRAEPTPTPFDHHVVVFAGSDIDLDLSDALSLAKLRAIEHRMAIGVLSPTIREMIKTNRYKNIQRFQHDDGVFGLDAMFMAGTYAYAHEGRGNGICVEWLPAYRALIEPEDRARVRFRHGAIVRARYKGKVYEPVRVIRPEGWGWSYVHWADDKFCSVQTEDIEGPSSKKWVLEEVAADFDHRA